MNLSALRAKDVMNSDPSPLGKGPLGNDVAIQFLSGWFSGWPVVDDQNRLIGMVTEGNILAAVCAGYDLAAVPVEDIMTVPPVVVEVHDSLLEVLQRMMQDKLPRISVVDEQRDLVGIITRAELFAATSSLAPSTRLLSACSWCERIEIPGEVRGDGGEWQVFTRLPSVHDPRISATALAPTYCPWCFAHLEALTARWADGRVRAKGPETGPPRLLVVDDQWTVTQCLAEALEQWGYQVVSAAHGEEGLQVLARQRIDGILLDLHMPGMDGPTMLDELRWRGFRMPVIMMSGEADDRRLRSLLAEGAQGFVTKPVALDSLKSMCQKIFGSIPVHRETSSRVT